MAVEVALEPIMKGIINMFACIVVLITGCWVKILVLTRGGSRVVSVVLGEAEQPAA